MSDRSNNTGVNVSIVGDDRLPDNVKVRLLGISGSPRKKSTDHAVREALEYAQEKYDVETDYFSARGKEMKFCIHCDHCIKTKQGCIHKDDLVDLYQKMEWADAWIIGTPVYQGTLSAQTKTIMDRCRAVVARDPKVFMNKVGAGIAVGGDRVGGQEPAIQTILNFYVINEMLPVSGGSFGSNLGGTFWSQDRGAEGVAEDEEGLRSMRRTIRKLITKAQLMQKLR
ncbi:MAG: flavodoxin family protein [Methanosarcinaceae archaeon]|nr:flavodoxin family protein [Methanosarcinaceae archaeon]